MQEVRSVKCEGVKCVKSQRCAVLSVWCVTCVKYRKCAVLSVWCVKCAKY